MPQTLRDPSVGHNTAMALILVALPLVIIVLALGYDYLRWPRPPVRALRRLRVVANWTRQAGRLMMLAQKFRSSGSVLRIAAVTALVAWGTANPVSSKSDSGASLAGSWSGGGWVSFASGNKETARCHAHYSRAGGGGELSARAPPPLARLRKQQACTRLAQIVSAAVSTMPNTTCRGRSTSRSMVTARA